MATYIFPCLHQREIGKGGRRDGLVSAQSKPGQSLGSKEIFAAPPISASSYRAESRSVVVLLPNVSSKLLNENRGVILDISKIESRPRNQSVLSSVSRKEPDRLLAVRAKYFFHFVPIHQ
jgi:hypothetical protein